MSRRAAGNARRLRFEGLESRLAMATLYVSPLGNDAGSGSETAPWRTLQKAADSVVAGDTVIVRPGNYAGFHLTADGTADSPITFRADGNVLINAHNPATPDGINLEGADYITIDGFSVNGMPRAGIRSVINHHVTISNNRTDANGVWGIFTGFSEDVLIEGNVTTRSLQEHGIYVSNSADRPVIRGNTSWGNYANGIHMNGDVSMGGDGIISGALVENNVIYDNGRGGGSGINADGVQNSVFRNNLIYGNHASGMSLYRIDGGGGSSGNLVANNTIVGAADSRWALNINSGSTGNTVVNNALYSHHSFRGSITISPDSLAGFKSDYNAVESRFTLDDGDSVLSLDQWRAATGQDAHSIVAAPNQLFVNADAGDYHLSATSPALDAGTLTGAPTVDLDGISRPSGAGVDIGAYERLVTPANRPPTAVNDSAATTAGAAVDVDVLANDSDPDGTPTSVHTFTQPAGGTVTRLANGQLRYAPSAGFAGSDSFTYTITDGALVSAAATVSLSVQAVSTNQAPTNVSLSGTAIRENSTAGAVVGTLSASDPDTGDGHTFTLLDNAGGRFSLSGSQLVVASGAVLDYEASPSHTVVVRATDEGGLSYDRSLAVSVQNVNELVGFDVQRGASQRSYIRYLDLVFESDAGLNQLVSEGRFRLTRFGLTGTGSGASVSLGGRMQVFGNRVQVDFGAAGIGGNANSTTGNGYYQLSVDADRNGTQETTRHFYRLLGDTNGDRVVSSLDRQAVDAAFGQTGINLNADVNGDGVVNRKDRSIVKNQIGRQLGATLPLDD